MGNLASVALPSFFLHGATTMEFMDTMDIMDIFTPTGGTTRTQWTQYNRIDARLKNSGTESGGSTPV